MHKPVLLNAVLSLLAPAPGQCILDGTIGSGGHAEAVLKAVGPEGFLVGLDRDVDAIRRSEARLRQFEGRFILKHAKISQLDQILSILNITQVHAVLLDMGLSSDQLNDAARGFSFQREGPLDMRMDPSEGVPASQLINQLNEHELKCLFREYGEERRAAYLAKVIARAREHGPINSTKVLAEIICRATPARFRYGRIHPATRIFQALRIAVNSELDELSEGLPKAFDALVAGGRLAVISFHSLEDRIVKHFFIKQKQKGAGNILTKKPVQSDAAEREANPSSRSAKLRAIERL